jgi:hypothetical protein
LYRGARRSTHIYGTLLRPQACCVVAGITGEATVSKSVEPEFKK